MIKSVYFVSELYTENDKCHSCNNRGALRIYYWIDGILEACRLCYECSIMNLYYPNYYIYYAGMTGYITLYGDTGETLTMYYTADDERVAKNNLSEAKTKRKL